MQKLLKFMKEPVKNPKEFLDRLSSTQKGFLKKPKGTGRIFVWWEDDEKWFFNVQHWSPRNKDEKSVWFIAKDLDEWLEFMGRKGYEMHLEEK